MTPHSTVASQDTRAPRQAGYSLVEMMISMGIMIAVTGAIFQLVADGQSGFRTQPEIADVHQRLRIAADMIYKDLLSAGAGPYVGDDPGPISSLFPAVLPGRYGAMTPDAELSAATDRITIYSVPSTQAQTVLAEDMSAPNADLRIDTLRPGCPASSPCGFVAGMRGLIFDMSSAGAGYDAFTVTSVTADQVGHGGSNPTMSRTYDASTARVVEANQAVYYLDAANNQLRHYDGYELDLPLVDDVVALKFTYFASPDPASAPKPAEGLSNCVFAAGDPPTPLLATLQGTALKALTQSQFTDGPPCGVVPNRFDGDLLRVRKIGVEITVQVGREDLRGDDPDQFVNVGTASGGDAWVPDYSMKFEVAPRNMNLLQ
ncbi:MAG: prepilin-type N-terminal cleavage/methylation domain-containing protein [Acidobacteria bacterium]|nr:prepilin-type N-terminal cleavage/methylation domain-containing protein [Acidobacteriota bacterium]